MRGPVNSSQNRSVTVKIIEKLKKNWFTVLTLVISVGILLCFLLSNDGIATLSEIITTLQFRWLFVTLLAAAACWILEGLALHLIVKHVWKDWDYKRSFSVGMVGLLYSAITPSATGGQPMQIYTMHNMGIDTGVACSVSAVKTLSYQTVMLFYALAMVIWKLRYFQTNVSNFSFITIIGILCNSLFIAAVCLFMVSEKTTDRILRGILRLAARMKLCRNPEKQYEKVHGQLAMFHDASKIMGNSARFYVPIVAVTVLQITLNSLIPYFIYRSFNYNGADIFTMIAAQVFVAMVSAFVPLPGSSGGAESCFYLFFGPYFRSAIWPAVLLWRFITYYLNILFGSVCTYWSNRYIRKLKAAVPAAEPSAETAENSEKTPGDMQKK